MHWMRDNYQRNNEGMNSKLENLQYSAALAITGAIRSKL